MPSHPHHLTWSSPPADLHTNFSPDGALLGDGRLGAVVGGGDGEVLLSLGSNDAWSRHLQSPVPVGLLRLTAPGAFALEHHLRTGLVTARLGGLEVGLRIHDGVVLVELTNHSGTDLAVGVSLLPGWSWRAPFPTAGGQIAGWPWVERSLQHRGDGDGVVALGICAPGAQGPELVLAPGACRLLGVAVRSHRDTASPRTVVQSLMAAWDAGDLARLAAAHTAHWQAFWQRGQVELPDDPVLDRFRTAALAILGSAMRPDALAPGLYGPWVTTDDPAWHGDYHLNYNFQAPIQGLWTADRPELALAHLHALSAAVPTFRRYAAADGLPGLFAPVSLGPDGILPEGGIAWSQRGNSLYCALSFIRHVRATGDRPFLASTAYPFLCGVADYWEAWLQAGADGLLHIRDSTAHELPPFKPGETTHGSLMTRAGTLLRDDPMPDLVHLRVVLASLIAFAGELGIDAARVPRWRDILARLAPVPELDLPDGGRAFALVTGMDHIFAPDHVPSHCIFPSLAIGPGSPQRSIELARNTLRAADAWRQTNAFCLVLPAAVRVAYPGAADLLRSAITDLMAPNGLVITSKRHGGIETCGAMCAVDDLLMQSQDGVIHLFPVWERQRPTSFTGLRADGAFLVSARCEHGRIDDVRIRSEQGRTCAVAGELAVEAEDGAAVPVRHADGITSFPTRPGVTYRCRGPVFDRA